MRSRLLTVNGFFPPFHKNRFSALAAMKIVTNGTEGFFPTNWSLVRFQLVPIPQTLRHFLFHWGFSIRPLPATGADRKCGANSSVAN